MIGFLVAGAMATSVIAAPAGPWTAQDSRLIGRSLARPPVACAVDGVTAAGGRVTGAKFYRQMIGFAQAAKTDGGLHRKLLVVSRADDTPGKGETGSLRWAVTQAAAAGGGWIAFAPGLRGATIRLRAPLRLASNITIDGGCVMPRLVGAGRGSILYVRGSHNIVVSRLQLEQAGGGGDGDCITVSHGADRIWLAYLRLRHCRDGLIDVTRDKVAGPMRVTISNNRFTDHDKAMLVVGSPLPPPCRTLQDPIRLTVARNIFYRTGQRHPRASGDALVHLQDNVIAFAPRKRADGQGGAYGTLAADGAHIKVERTLYIPPAGGRSYRLMADQAGPAGEADGPCRRGYIDRTGADPGSSRVMRDRFIRAIIRMTDPPVD